MPVYRILILFSVLAALTLKGQEKTEPIRVMTYNIWYDNPNNTGNTWADRKALLVKSLLEINPDILGVQEALAHQVEDIEKEGYQSFGAGRDDGQHGGEHTAVFFKKENFRMIEGGNFWLSPWPDSIGLPGWDAVLPRIATWVHLENIISGKSFYVFNTHFSHVGDTARLESARLIMREIRRIAGSAPVILMGDFNCRKGSPPYNEINREDLSVPLRDTRYLLPQPVQGPDHSFAGSTFRGEPGNIIDHIFVSGNVKVANYQIVDNCAGGQCPSDHLPVLAVLELN